MNDLAVQEQRTTAITPMQLLEVALQRDSNIDVIERLAKLQREEREYQAAVDFNEALNRCQSRMMRIAADMENPQTHSQYASYAALDRAIRPIYVGEGFAVSFGEAEGSTADYIVMLGYLSLGGHMRVFRKGMPITTKGPKGNDVMTSIHASGSAGSYAKRYLLKDMFNLAVGEDDTDGNVDPQWVDAKLQEIRGAATKDTLHDVYMGAAKEAATAKDKGAVRAISEAKDAKQRDFEEAEELEGRENAKALFEQHSNLHGFNKYIVPQMKTMPHWFKTMAAVEAVNRGYVADKSTGSYAEGR